MRRVDLTNDEVRDDLEWVESLKLVRGTRPGSLSFARDFCDGVMAAEIMAVYHPRLVDSHSYSSVNARDQKVNNWKMLNARVLRKVNLPVSSDEIRGLVDVHSGVAERILERMRIMLDPRAPAPEPGGPEMPSFQQQMADKDATIEQLLAAITELEETSERCETELVDRAQKMDVLITQARIFKNEPECKARVFSDHQRERGRGNSQAARNAGAITDRPLNKQLPIIASKTPSSAAAVGFQTAR